MRRIAALIAPVAQDAGAVADDETVVEIASAVCDAFGHEDAGDGLTKAEILDRIDGRFPTADVESRLDLFIRLELLRPILEKKHQSRYVLNPAGVVGLLVFERIGERGGIDELLHLLDRTRRLIESGGGTEATVAGALERLRGLFALFANEVSRLVAIAPLDELLAERRFHDRADLITQVASLNAVVTDQFPSLDRPAYRVVVEAQRYVSAVQDLVARVLDEGGEARDFGVLAPEDYLTAAITASVADLAGVFGTVVFDPARPWLDAGAIVEVVETYRPRRSVRVRPPEPAGAPAADPLALLEEEHARLMERRALKAEQHLQGQDTAQVSTILRGTGWPGAATALADFLALDADVGQPYRLELDDEAIVDSAGPVSYVPRGTIARERATPDRMLEPKRELARRGRRPE